MFERIADAASSSAVVNVISLASWDVLPALLIAYTFQSLLARCVRLEFSLRKSEAAELERALLLHRKVCRRLNDLDESRLGANGFWRAIFALAPAVDRCDADEREDLQAHAHHLRITVMRLRRLPLERLRSFVHIASLRFALGCAVAFHIAAFVLFFLVFRSFGHMSAHELTGSARDVLVWYPLDRRLFQANAVGACFVVLAIPLSYLLRRAALRRELGLEFCLLKDLAATAPDREIDRMDADLDLGASAPSVAVGQGADEWFTILGVAPSATVEQVREAYKALIKQNHPDLVQDMSPAIRRFAETETKRLNVAYQEALSSAS